jgi:hypothetical protein
MWGPGMDLALNESFVVLTVHCRCIRGAVRWRNCAQSLQHWQKQKNRGGDEGRDLEFCGLGIRRTHYVSQSQFVTRLQALKGEWLSQEDAILPIEPRFINDIKQGKKTAEYRSYIMPKVKRIWFCPNRGRRHITLMAEVLPAEEHNDKRPDGTKKRPLLFFSRDFALVTVTSSIRRATVEQL